MPSNATTRPASSRSARDDERAEKTTEILKKIRTLEIKTRGLVETAFAGDYHSVFKGRGMNFEDVREYQPGDEIRSIDWNVTARMGTAFVKKFTEERELTVMLVVDVSASGNFGSTTQSKRELAAEVACLLAFSAIRNNDKVGLILFTDRVELFIPPKKGRSHTLRLIREILFFQPQGRGTEPALALDYLNKIVTRRAVVFFISDFQAPDFSRALAVSGRRHDFIAIHIHDERESVVAEHRHDYIGGRRDRRTDRDQHSRSQNAGSSLRTLSTGAKQNFPARCGGTISMRSRCKLEKIICRRCARFSNNANAGLVFDETSDGVWQCWSNEMNSSSNTPSLHYSITPALLVLAEEFHDIAPPLDYSLIPPWLVFVIVFVALSLLGLVVWLFAKRRKPPLPPKLPREIALEELERIGAKLKG